MNEIQHSGRAHARLNASSSHRWMMCPPSVRLSEQFADKPSSYAEEGTFLHELCELKLHRYLGDMAPDVIEAQYAEHRDSEFYTQEAETVTDEYIAFCVETIEAVKSSCPDPLIMFIIDSPYQFVSIDDLSDSIQRKIHRFIQAFRPCQQ